VRLLTVDRDIVAGIYPRTQAAGDASRPFPVEFPQGRLVSDAFGFLEAERVPGGFLRIKRGVLERLAFRAAQYRAEGQKDGEPLYARIFERTLEFGDLRDCDPGRSAVVEHRELPGDFVFCKKARAEGYRIFVDPEMRFSHAGAAIWSGCLGDHLRRKATEAAA
jgi:hypothetical protein